MLANINYQRFLQNCEVNKFFRPFNFAFLPFSAICTILYLFNFAIYCGTPFNAYSNMLKDIFAVFLHIFTILGAPNLRFYSIIHVFVNI